MQVRIQFLYLLKSIKKMFVLVKYDIWLFKYETNPDPEPYLVIRIYDPPEQEPKKIFSAPETATLDSIPA